jgi:hypothetical protein
VNSAKACRERQLGRARGVNALVTTCAYKGRVSKQWKPGKQTVELRPSRIRRDPPPPRADNALARKLDRIDWSSREWEIRLAVAGIIFFALAISAVVFDIGELLSQ